MFRCREQHETFYPLTIEISGVGLVRMLMSMGLFKDNYYSVKKLAPSQGLGFTASLIGDKIATTNNT